MPPDLKSAISWMYDLIKPGSDFLDFGCATGYFGSYIKKNKNCKVYGVEVSSDAKEAKKVLDGVYSFDLDDEWPEEVYERKYDYLFFGDVLEHLKDSGLALSKCKELLKPAGVILVSVPNIAHLSTRLELIQGSFEYESMGILDNTHLKYFTLSSFTKMANENGYQIESVDSTVNDYPQEITKKILKKVGLEPTKKFWDMSEEFEARAYQYKFVLKPVSGKVAQKSLTKKPLPPKPEQQRDSFIEDLRGQVKLLDEHSKKQAEIIEHYVKLNKQLEEENEHLKHKFSYKIKSSLSRQSRKKHS